MTMERLKAAEKQPTAVECPECGAAWLLHSFQWGTLTEGNRYVVKCETCDAPLTIEKSGLDAIVRSPKTKSQKIITQVD